MGMRMAGNISYYLFTVVVLTYAAEYAAIDKAVLCAKETSRSSLRHDRVVPEAHV